MGEVREQTVLVIGKTGSGKSRLVNLILKQKRAQSCRQTTSVTKECNMYKIYGDDNTLLYTFIDTMGLADTDESNEQIIQKIKDFLKTGVTIIHWVIVTLSGAERITRESSQVLADILEFLELQQNTDHILFCVTHADGWSQKVKDQYTEHLKKNSSFSKLTESGQLQIHFSGIPDPDELEDEVDKDYAKKKEEMARKQLLHLLPFHQTGILEQRITEWKQMDIDKRVEEQVRNQLEKERGRRRPCTII
jgi:GTPase Era involved in 16S rRNA processing